MKKGADYMNQEITEFIASKPAWQLNICTQLHEAVHRAIPEVQERIQYKKPHYLKNGKYAAVISTAKDTVSFTIFNASDIEFPEGLFEGPAERKTIKLREGQIADYENLSSLLRQASISL
jgi:hypothetical protein